MERRNFLPAILGLVSVLALAPLARGQFEPVPQAFKNDADIVRIFSQGRSLEQESRWGEALSHYENAARKHPEHRELQHRLTLSRIHYDLARRHSDHSYISLTKSLSEQQAVDLLGEVMLKIQSHYVHAPDWNQLLHDGTQCLEIALADEDFMEKNHVTASAEQVRQTVQHVRKVLADRDVRTRRQAQEMVRWIGQFSAYRLNVPSHSVILEYMCGGTGALDSYSSYLTGDQLDEVYAQIEGNFVGLGIELKADNGSLLIANVIPGGPADKSGIRVGDRIIEVDGRSTRDVSTDVAADMLKGEQGSYVHVLVLSADGKQRGLHVRRDRVDVPSVEDVKMVDSDLGVAYFRISSFQKTTSRDVDAALWKLHRNGMRSLIIDVRDNPGGLLTQSVEVADRFVTDGTIVTTHGRSPRENYKYKANRGVTWRVPLVVLINEDSASASEIFAGAIRDHRRGTVVGRSSYGKGSVQGIFPLRIVKAGVRLTTAKFYSPSGHAISHGGVSPDIVVQAVAKPVDSKPPRNDAILNAGVRIATDMLADRRQVRQSGAKTLNRDS